MNKFFCCLILCITGVITLSAQDMDTLAVFQDTLPEFNVDALSDTLITRTDSGVNKTVDFQLIQSSFFLSELEAQAFTFSSIPWSIPREQVEALLTLRGFAQDTLDRWISAIGEDTLYCYPGYQNEGITSFQLLYLPEMRTEEALLKKYRMITGILRKKYGNPSYIAVYDVKNYSPGKPFYTQKWISGNELLVTSINRADRHINIQYFFEPDSIVKKKIDYEKRLYELF
ncbi:MAG: hypothetical protein DRP86_06380 [Candidatus Neomarinimicrobiota bacterium]|nr:hypothetical protein [Candidatus Neomarinimicrobiota bacterium]RKY48553.1 MAG: hypothetical protein DRP86_06380 [Candidatus Neomarinimicrobiota bacterium]